MVVALAAYVVEEKMYPLLVNELIGMYHKKMRELEKKPATTEIHLKIYTKHGSNELKVEGNGSGRGHMTFIAQMQTIGEALKSEYEQIVQSSRIILQEALSIRETIISSSPASITGRCKEDCITYYVPEQLLTFLRILLQGPTYFNDGSNKQRTNVACILSQLVMLNTA